MNKLNNQKNNNLMNYIRNYLVMKGLFIKQLEMI